MWACEPRSARSGLPIPGQKIRINHYKVTWDNLFLFFQTGVAMKKTVAGLTLLGVCFLAQAQPSKWRFFAGVGLSNGGETIMSGTITTIGTTQTLPFEIQAGTGTQYRLGADYRFADRLTLQGSIGRAVSDPMGMNGSLTFTVTPVELLGFVNITESLRIGAGLRKSYADMSGTGVSANWSGIGSYSSSGGSVVEAQYLFATSEAMPGAQKSQFGISGRWVNESFTHNTTTFKGNTYEIGLALYY